MYPDSESLIRRIAADLLNKNQSSDSIPLDASLDAYKSNFPVWLIRFVEERCDNSLEPREDEIRKILADPFIERCVVDHMILEGNSRKLLDMELSQRMQFAEERKVDLADNRINQAFSKMDFTLKFESNFLVSHLPEEERQFRLDAQMMGTISLINIGTRAVYAHTMRILKNKYSKDDVARAFREIYLEHSTQGVLFEWAVLVVCAIPKLFTIRDFVNNQNGFGELVDNPDGNVRSQFMSIVGLFDRGVNPLFPGSRFRIGLGVDQEIVNRLGSAYWLKKTLERVKAEQREEVKSIHARPVDGFVGKSSLLKVAIAQKSPVSISLPLPSQGIAPYSALLMDFSDEFMTLYMLQSNPIPRNWIGEGVKGTFCVKTGKDIVTYCELKTILEQVETVSEKLISLKLRFPDCIDVFRRSMIRLVIDSECICLLEFQQCQTVRQPGGTLSRKGVSLPIVCLPERIDFFRVEDISAAGMRLKVFEQQGDGLWRGLFVGCELITRIVLPTQSEREDFEATLLSTVKNIAVNSDGSKAIGLQFLETGMTKPNGTMSWQPVGENGYWALGEWIFKYGSKWSRKMRSRRAN